MGEPTSVRDNIKEFAQHTCRNGTLLRDVTSWNDNIAPRILYFNNSQFLVIEGIVLKSV